jgi:hypothetical protein
VSAESEAAFLIALEDYRLLVSLEARFGASIDTTALTAAAQDHVGVSRPHSEVAAEYAEANADPEANPEAVQELAQELNAIRIAQAVAEGNLPYRPPVVTTES